jgi:hypothetical protein
MPSYGNFLLDKGYNVAAAITKYRAVKFSAAETVTPVTAITDVIAGFPQFDVSSSELTNRNKGASVRVLGVTEAEAVGAIAVGSLVTLEADGRVSSYVAASGKRVLGRCIGAAAANAGDRIALLLSAEGQLA